MSNSYIINYDSIALSLMDGGWTSSDREQLITEYDLTGEEADTICDTIARFETLEA